MKLAELIEDMNKLERYRIVLRQEYPGMVPEGGDILRDMVPNPDAKPLWIAMVLDHWIMAQGNTAVDALTRLARVIGDEEALFHSGQVNRHWTELEPAPDKYWQR